MRTGCNTIPNAPREDNRISGIVAKSSSDNTIVVIEADPTTKRLKVDSNLSSISGTTVSEYFEDDTHTSGDGGVMALAVRNDVLGALTGTDGDYSSLQTNASGALYTEVATQVARDRTTDNMGVGLQTDVVMNDTTTITPKFASIVATLSGNNTLVSAVSGKKIRVFSMEFVVGTADLGVRLENGASGTSITGRMDFAGNSGLVLPFSPIGWMETDGNVLLNMELSGAGTVTGSLVYGEI